MSYRHVALLLLGSLLAATADAATYKVIHSFAGGPADGAEPSEGLVADAGGNLYGVTFSGGTDDDYGTVFELSPPAAGGVNWAERVIHYFGAPGDGVQPYGQLLIDRNGALYGTTLYSNGVYGTVFKLSPPRISGGAWSESVLSGFAYDPASGATAPNPGLAMDASGALYGTMGTSQSSKFFGSVFRIAPSVGAGGQWIRSTIYAFKGSPDGAYPYVSVSIDGAGNLYGTTANGGAYGAANGGYGTVYTLTPPSGAGKAWTEQVVHSFQGQPIPAPTVDPVIVRATGKIFGSSYDYDSTADVWRRQIFKLSPPNATRPAWGFAVIAGARSGASTESYNLAGSLTFGSAGAIIATQLAGGPANEGKVFSLTEPAPGAATWVKHPLYLATGGLPQGINIAGPVVQDAAGNIFGVTVGGGNKNAGGVVFEITP